MYLMCNGAQIGDIVKLTDTQYQLLLNLYHEMNDEFKRLSMTTQSAFFTRLYAR
jgi:hypothetical protein